MDAADIQKRTRAHLVAFTAILVLALITTVPYFLPSQSNIHDVIDPYALLAIVTIQVAIVLFAMMRVRAEGLWVRGVFFFAVLFVAALLGLTALGHRSTIIGTERIQPAPAIAPADAETH